MRPPFTNTSETSARQLACASIREVYVPSVGRALDVLELLASTQRSLSLAEIHQALRIPKSSLHYLIQNLVYRGYIERQANGCDYSLGSSAARLAASKTESAWRMFYSEFLQQLAGRLRLPAKVGVLDGAAARIIATIDANRDTGSSWVGCHFDLHCTGLGKALIAHLPDSEIERLFPSPELRRHNRNTISSLALLHKQLAEVQAKGFAINNEEYLLGFRCVAAPIFNHKGRVTAALGVFASTSEMPPERLRYIGSVVAEAATEIQRYLRDGSVPPSAKLG